MEAGRRHDARPSVSASSRRTMSRAPAHVFSRFPIPAYAAAVVSAALVAFAGSPLPRITPDSAAYLTGAERLAEEGEFSSCERAITEYAPGYSAALAVFITAGLDAPDGARLLNVFATLVLVLAAAALARTSGLGNTAASLVAVATAVVPATLRSGAAAWSEQTFCALLAVLLVAIVNNGRGLEVRFSARLALVLVVSWALLLTRYSGLFVVPAVVVAASLGSRGSSRRVFRIGAFVGGLLAVPALWYARNIEVGSGAFGSRSGSDFSVGEVLRQVPDGLSSIVLPIDVPVAVRIVAIVPVVIAAGLAFASFRLPAIVLGTAVAGYLVGVTYAATTTRLDPVDQRLLSPVFVAAAVLVALAVAGHARSVQPRLERILRAWAIALVACMVVIAPGVVWYLHDAERTLDFDLPVTCAEWPSRYRAATGSVPKWVTTDGR